MVGSITVRGNLHLKVTFYIRANSPLRTNSPHSRCSHQIFYLLLFLLAFTSADVIFHKFLELHSTLSEKKIFFTNFPFLTDVLKLPHPLNGQNPLSVRKVFCRSSLIGLFLCLAKCFILSAHSVINLVKLRITHIESYCYFC